METKQLAGFVALRDVEDYPVGTCVAWMDSAERVCGKAADYLCPRHAKVAQGKLDKAVARHNAAAAKRAASAPERAAKAQAELDRIERRLGQIDPMRKGEAFDPAMVNLPLAGRMPSDSRITELARLHERRAQLLRLVS